MAFLKINNVSVVGMSACVPSDILKTEDIYKWDGCESFIGTTGIKQKRCAPIDVCSSDLCVKAAEKLIDDLGWERAAIDAVVFVSQTPDYVLPSTAPIIQDRLGLGSHCFTLDISLGCSGWVYALSVLGALMQNGTIRKGLLLAGDTPLKLCSPDDKSTYPIFGDAGTVTALEYDEGAEGLSFVLYSDGAGYKDIIVPDGGRNRISPDSLENVQIGDGIVRSRVNVEMDGMSVFAFGISKVPKIVNELAGHFGVNKDDVNLFGFHQANLFMNEKIRKKLKLSEEKVPYCIDEFGNTSCASIPLALVTKCRERLQNESLKHIDCGFGVGLSWGAVYYETNHIVCPELIEY